MSHPWKHPSSLCLVETPACLSTSCIAQARRYLGTEEVIPHLEALQNLPQMAAIADTVCS